MARPVIVGIDVARSESDAVNSGDIEGQLRGARCALGDGGAYGKVADEAEREKLHGNSAPRTDDSGFSI